MTGFDLSAMKPTKFEDGIIEVVDAKELMTTECPLKVSAHMRDQTELNLAHAVGSLRRTLIPTE